MKIDWIRKKKKYRVILSLLVFSVLGIPAILLLNNIKSENRLPKSTNQDALIRRTREKTFSLSTLCSTEPFKNNVDDFLKGGIDCKKVFSTTKKSDILNVNQGFIKVSPLSPPTKKIVMVLTTPDSATTNSFFKSVLLYDEKGQKITNGITFQKNNEISITGSGANSKYVVNRTLSNGTITLTLATPKIISKIIFENLENDFNAKVEMFTDRPLEKISRGTGVTTLDSSLGRSNIRFKSTVKEGNELVLTFDKDISSILASAPPRYGEIILFDENNSVINKSDYRVTVTPSTRAIHTVVFTFKSPRRISRVFFKNLLGRITINSKFTKIIQPSEVAFISKTFIVNDAFREKGIINLDDFNNVLDSYKSLSKLNRIVLLDASGKKVPFSVSAKETYFDEKSSIETCDSLLQCAEALQPPKTSLRNGLNFTKTSYFAINALSKFEKIRIIGDNIRAFFSFTTKHNYNFKNTNNVWHEVSVTKIGNLNTPNETVLNMNNLKEAIKLNCEELLKDRFRWAMPKACDFLTQVLPTTNEDMTSYGEIQNLKLKAEALYEYPWWDIQKVLFNKNMTTSLELDFASYTSSIESFNANIVFYLKNLFKNNADRLDKLTIKGPLTSNLAAAISKLTSLKELVIDGAQLTDFTFLKSLSSLTKITIRNTLLKNVSGLLDGSSNLTSIDLSNNQIAEVPSGSFSGLTSLKDLNLSNNKIVNIADDAFPNGATLTTLNLSNNKLESLPLLTPLTALMSLDASHNNLTSIPSGVIALASLRKLKVNDNKLTLTPISSTPSELTELDIRNNPITDFLANLNVLHPKLTSLSIGGATYELNKDAQNSKYSVLVQYIRSVASKLTTLRIENMNLINKTVEDLLTKLNGMQNLNLKVLSFGNNQLHNFSNTSQKVPTSLEELDLSNQNGLSIIPAFIKNITTLKKLNLSENSFTTIQKIDWPSTLEEIDVSKNPLASYSTLSTLKGIKTIIAKGLSNLEIDVEDYATFAETFNTEKVTIIASETAFNPDKLYEAQNPYKLQNINLYLVGSNSDKMMKVDFFDQYMLVYEDTAIHTLRSKLRLDALTTKAVMNYKGKNERVFYLRPPIDKKSISDSPTLQKYLDRTLNSISTVAWDFRLKQQDKELQKAVKDVDNSSISSSTSIKIAATLVILLILANGSLAAYYLIRRRKKKLPHN